MMTKKDIEQSEISESWLHSLMDQGFYARYGKVFLLGLVGAMLLLVLLSRLISSSQAKAEQDFLHASAEYIRLQDPDNVADEHIDELQEILKRHGELHPKYDGVIAQAYLHQGDVESARGYISLVLNRVPFPFRSLYGDFAENSLLLHEGKFKEAYERALLLKESLEVHPELNLDEDGDFSFGELLYAYNLIRMAMLAQEVGESAEELALWERIRSKGGWDEEKEIYIEEKASEGYWKAITTFQSGNVNLYDYMKFRVKELGEIVQVER